VSALGLKDYIGRIFFNPRHIWFFQVVQLRLEVVGLISGPLIVRARPKI